MLLSKQCPVVQEAARALVFSNPLRLPMHSYSVNLVLKARSKLTQVAILAVPKRNQNLSWNWGFQSCTWNCMISSVFVYPFAGKCSAFILLKFLRSVQQCVDLVYAKNKWKIKEKNTKPTSNPSTLSNL